MTKTNNLIISMRRHAHTDKTADQALSEDRSVDWSGIISSGKLGFELRKQKIIQGYSSPAFRSQQTLYYIMNRYYSDCTEFKIYIKQCLDKPTIGEKFREIIEANTTNRDERINFYLKNPDPYNETNTPHQAACAAANFVSGFSEVNDWNGRVEAITNAPKLEAFLEILDKKAFEKHLGGKSFDYLEGIELRKQNGIYLVKFRDKELQVKESKIDNLANKYLKK